MVILRSFLKELTHDFGEKSVIFLFVFNKISLEIMSDDHLVKNQALSPIKGASNVFSFNKLFSLYKFLSKVSQQVSQSVSKSTSQLVSQSVRQPVSQSVRQSAS